jgi:radical SAM protein with 4Fe4S-binding SPASM domain
MLILRRESFGGMLVDTGNGGSRLLDPAGYQQQLQQLQQLLSRERGESIRIVDISARGRPLLTDALATPADLFLELTYRCQGSCRHCYASAGPQPTADEMSFSEVAQLIQELSRLGTYYVRLTGGEPTLREDLPDIIELITAEGMIASLNSNGLAGGQTLCHLVDRGVRDLLISLDGDQETNDAIRGHGSYHRVVGTLNAVAAHIRSAACPAELTVNMVLMQSNRHCLQHLAELVAGLGCKLSIGLLRPSGRADQSQMLSPGQVLASAAEVCRLREQLHLPGRQIRCNFDVLCSDEAAPGPWPFPLDGSSCALGARGIGVTPQGRIVACNYLAGLDHGRWLGEDVRGADLLRLWHESPVLQQARRVRRQGCRSCAYHIRRCNGGCPATAYVATGNLDGHDPYCVRDVAARDENQPREAS